MAKLKTRPSFRSACLIVGLLLVATNVEAIRFISKTDAQRAAEAEERIKNSSLKIGADCQPEDALLRIRLKTYDAEDLREFWRGQTYAIERTYRTFLRRERERLIADDADRRILEIETQRDEAILRQRGIEPRNSAKFDATVDRIDASIARRYGERAQRKYEWYLRCGAYADEQSRR